MVRGVHIGCRWYTFDATQGQPRGGRIVVVYGRDAADVAFISNDGGLTTTTTTLKAPPTAAWQSDAEMLRVPMLP